MSKKHRRPALGSAGAPEVAKVIPFVHPQEPPILDQVMKEQLIAIAAEATRRAQEVEYKFSLQDTWSVQLFIAIAQKHGLKPYRSHGQKSQTIMVRATKDMIDGVVWPEFNALADKLHAALHEATNRIIAEAVGLR